MRFFSCGPRVAEPSEAMLDVEEAREYDRITCQYLDILHKGFVETILNGGVRGGTVLDVGTGTGRVATELARHCPALRVVGIDLSPVMLSVARENAASLGVTDRVRFLIGDAKSLPFPDQVFDAVVSHNMLHHLPAPLPLIREAFRVARPGAAVFIRDLVRPPDTLVPVHVGVFGYRYHPIMKKGYLDSIRAGLTWAEWKGLGQAFASQGAMLTRQFITHATLQRLSRPGPAPSLHLPGSPLSRLARRLYARP